VELKQLNGDSYLYGEGREQLRLYGNGNGNGSGISAGIGKLNGESFGRLFRLLVHLDGLVHSGCDLHLVSNSSGTDNLNGSINGQYAGFKPCNANGYLYGLGNQQLRLYGNGNGRGNDKSAADHNRLHGKSYGAMFGRYVHLDGLTRRFVCDLHLVSRRKLHRDVHSQYL
jgi:hypothetical protein